MRKTLEDYQQYIKPGAIIGRLNYGTVVLCKVTEGAHVQEEGARPLYWGMATFGNTPLDCAGTAPIDFSHVSPEDLGAFAAAERITALEAENATLKRKLEHLKQTAADHCDRWSRAEGQIRKARQEAVFLQPLIDALSAVRPSQYPGNEREIRICCSDRQALLFGVAWKKILAALDPVAGAGETTPTETET